MESQLNFFIRRLRQLAEDLRPAKQFAELAPYGDYTPEERAWFRRPLNHKES